MAARLAAPLEAQRFYELQYLTLRKEIEDTHARMFTLLIGGSALVPAAQFLSEAFRAGVFLVVLPFLVVVLVLLFLSQNVAIMRCGQYIREHIEAKIPDITGWETWEEQRDDNGGGRIGDRRIVDNLLNYGFYLLSGLYYVVSVYLAEKAIWLVVHALLLRTLGATLPPFIAQTIAVGFATFSALVTLLIYYRLGRWTAYVLLYWVRSSTTTNDDQGPLTFDGLYRRWREINREITRDHAEAETSAAASRHAEAVSA